MLGISPPFAFPFNTATPHYGCLGLQGIKEWLETIAHKVESFAVSALLNAKRV